MWLYPASFIIIIFLSFYYYKRNRMIFFGMMFYLLNIILMLRIIPVAENIMPDRYNYVPSIGFFIILYSLYLFVKNYKPRFLHMAKYSLAGYLVLLFILTILRSQVWKSGEAIWFDAYKKYPDNTYILQNIANLQISQNKIKDGFATVDKALEADPQNILALISRLKANTALKNTVALEKDLNYLRKLEPTLAENFANRANALFLYGDMRRDGALIKQSYEAAIESYPYNSKFYFNLGVFYYATRDYDAAIQNLEKGISFKPYNIDYYYLYLGMAKFQMEEIQAAAGDFKKALRYNPENKEVKKWLQNTSFNP
jgi:tetratricopeptide (TPR) repeat protein